MANSGERVVGVTVSDDALTVDLADGRTISTPLAWYPKLLHATPEQRGNWLLAGAGYGIHWPEIDEDLSSKACFEELLHQDCMQLRSERTPWPLKRYQPKRSRQRATT